MSMTADPIIDKFINEYSEEYTIWKNIAKGVEEFCDEGTNGQKIRAIVTSRAKEPHSLREKVKKVNQENLAKGEKGFTTVYDIYDRICDFAGVRISLYFPSQTRLVERFITSNFEISNIRKHEGRKTSGLSGEPRPETLGIPSAKFPGYMAQHYRVKVDNWEGKRVGQPPRFVEIQVMSLILHVWSEIEHDIEYKNDGHKPSLITSGSLDMLNGLVLTGERIIETLYISQVKETLERDSDKNFPDAFALEVFLAENKTLQTTLRGSSMQVLWEFLATMNNCTPTALGSILKLLLKDENSKKLRHYRNRLKIDVDMSLAIILQVLRQELMYESSTLNPAHENFIKLILNEPGAQNYDYRQISSCSQRCNTILNSLLWLLGLFGAQKEFDSHWSDILNNLPSDTAEGMNWAADGVERMPVLKGKVDAVNNNDHKIERLWIWFVVQLNSRNPMISVPFGISLLGVQRKLETVPEELLGLRRLLHKSISS